MLGHQRAADRRLLPGRLGPIGWSMPQRVPTKPSNSQTQRPGAEERRQGKGLLAVEANAREWLALAG